MASMAVRAIGLFAALWLVLTAGTAAAQTIWNLVTPEEAARDDAAPHVAAPPDSPGPPRIDLLRPDISRPIQNPVTIEVRFSPSSGSAIDMSTFRARYGRLGIDITRRLLEHAETTANGLVASNVDL